MKKKETESLVFGLGGIALGLGIASLFGSKASAGATQPKTPLVTPPLGPPPQESQTEAPLATGEGYYLIEWRSNSCIDREYPFQGVSNPFWATPEQALATFNGWVVNPNGDPTHFNQKDLPFPRLPSMWCEKGLYFWQLNGSDSKWIPVRGSCDAGCGL